MGGAIAKAVTKKGYRVVLYDTNTEKCNALGAQLGAKVVGSLDELLSICTFVFVGVKPQVLEALANEIRPRLDSMGNAAPLLISMAAGTSIARLEELFGKCYIIRIMPNTPVAEGKGMTVWCANDLVFDAQKEAFIDIMSESGRVDAIDEKLIDAASAVSGCGPAFVYIVECAFLDNKTDIKIIDTAEEQKKMGVAIAKGILKTLGISYQEPKAVDKSTYRVQVFAGSNSGAEAMVKKLKAAGFDAIMTKIS